MFFLFGKFAACGERSWRPAKIHLRRDKTSSGVVSSSVYSSDTYLDLLGIGQPETTRLAATGALEKSAASFKPYKAQDISVLGLNRSSRYIRFRPKSDSFGVVLRCKAQDIQSSATASSSSDDSKFYLSLS
jgi:hypothetical protein